MKVKVTTDTDSFEKTTRIEMDERESALLADAFVSHHAMITRIIGSLPQIPKKKQMHVGREYGEIAKQCEELYDQLVVAIAEKNLSDTSDGPDTKQ